MPATRRINKTAHPNGEVFESADPERTEAFIAATFGNAMRVGGVRDEYRFQFAPLTAGELQLNTIDHTATTYVRAEPLPEDLAVMRIHRGVRTNIDVDDRLGPGDRSLNAHPGKRYHIRTTPARFTFIIIPIEAAAAAAGNRPDDHVGPLYFHSLRPVDPAAARRWMRAADYVTQSLLANPDAMAQPLLCGAATRLLAAALLSTFPNTWATESHHQDRTDATPTTMTRAVDFIETNADLDITITDIARAAYVTIRAVQLAFRRHLNTTPMAYLRRTRLDRAHEQLRNATPGEITIAEVAARWGFADHSRFTALYRRTYGQLPSHTLQS